MKDVVDWSERVFDSRVQWTFELRRKKTNSRNGAHYTVELFVLQYYTELDSDYIVT